MASLALGLLFAAPDAHAGTYSVPVYSGGTITDNANTWKLDWPFAFSSSTGTYQGSVVV